MKTVFDEVEKELAAKRKECLEKDRKDRIYNVAADYRCFFDGLIAAGFNEDQAMSILLEKCTFLVN